MTGFFRQLHHHLIDDVVLIAVLAVFEKGIFQVFFQTTLIALIVHAKIERPAVAVEEGANLAQNLLGLQLYVGVHVVLRIYHRGLELGVVVLATVVFLVGALTFEIEQSAYLVEYLRSFLHQAFGFDEVVRNDERGQLAQILVAAVGAELEEFVVMFGRLQPRHHLQLAEALIEHVADVDKRFGLLVEQLQVLAGEFVVGIEIAQQFEHHELLVVELLLVGVEHPGQHFAEVDIVVGLDIVFLGSGIGLDDIHQFEDMAAVHDFIRCLFVLLCRIEFFVAI